MDIDDSTLIEEMDEGQFDLNTEENNNNANSSQSDISKYKKDSNLLLEWSEILGIDTSKIFEDTARSIIVDKFDIKSDETLLSSPDLIKLQYWRNTIYDLEEKMQNTPKLQSVIKVIYNIILINY